MKIFAFIMIIMHMLSSSFVFTYLPLGMYVIVCWIIDNKVGSKLCSMYYRLDVSRISSCHWIFVHKWFSEADSSKEHNEHFIFFFTPSCTRGWKKIMCSLEVSASENYLWTNIQLHDEILEPSNTATLNCNAPFYILCQATHFL